MVPRCVGDGANMDIKFFPCWCPKLIAGIGALPDTIHDRCIVIEIRRKPVAVKVKQFRTDKVDNLVGLGRKSARWALDHIGELRDHDPLLPDNLNDRAADNWRPLITIAEAISDELAEELRLAAKAISASTPDAQDIGEMLVNDLHTIFDGEDFILTRTILEHLHAMESRPWIEYSRGMPITAHKLGNLLKRFGVTPTRQQQDNVRLRGYARTDLEPVWIEYLCEKA